MADVSKIKLPNGTTYNIKDDNALPLTGGSITGPVSFGDSVSIDEATIGDLVVNGNASFTNGVHGVIDKAKAADVTSTLNALVKYEDTEGTFSDSNIYNTSNNLIIGSTSVPGNIQIGAKNDSYGILPNTNNYNQIGSNSLYWYKAYVNNYYGLNSHITNWDAGKNIGTASTSSAAAILGSVYFYNACAAGSTQTKTLLSNGSATSNITVTLPNTTGTLALTSQIPDISGKADKATTLAGYGITDAKIASGVITLGSNTITPLTSSSALNAAKLSGAIPSAVTATTQASTDNSTKIATTAYVTTAIANLPEPMVFKGSVGTGGTVTSLPTAAASNEGHTYKVITALSSPSAKVGDTVISNGSEWIVIPSGDEPSGTVTSVGISNGGGLSVSGSPVTSSGTITVSHADTSSQASSSNSGRTYIQSITLDTYGHVTGISTATETVTDTNTWRTIQVNGTDVLGSGTGTGKLNLKAGSNVSVTNSSGTVTIAATDTTYESKAAASGGTAVSLVTTGEKYVWNNKIGATTPTIATDTGTSTITLASAGKYKLTAGGGSVIFTMPTIPTVSYPVTSVNSKTGAVSLTASDVGAAATSHAHGNITSGGDITATAPTIASGDQLVINDSSASKITNGPTFDGSTTTTALTPKGTWETFSKFSGSYNDLTNKPTSTATPTASTISEFDSTAHMNSTDMTSTEVTDFVDALDLPTNGIYNSIGEIVDGYLDGNFSCNSGSWIHPCSVTLTTGTWLVLACARWPNKSGGARAANVSTNIGNAGWDAVELGSADIACQLRWSHIFVVEDESATYYLNMYQNSGSVLTIEPSNAGGNTSLRAIRIG